MQWMGRGARLVRFFDQNRGSTMPRDLAHLQGRIRRTYEDAGKAFVELECWITNQRGEITTPGSALVELPRRGR
jgi:hypothetical protein